MKNQILFLSLFFTFASYSFAQETRISRINVKTARLQLIIPSIRTWNVGVEYFLGKQMRNSITLSPYLIHWNERGDTTLSGTFANHRGFGAILSYKYYFFGFTPKASQIQKGFYASAFVQPQYLSVDFVNLKFLYTRTDATGTSVIARGSGRNTQNIFSFQTGLLLGYQWIWWHRLTFDVYGGIGVRYVRSFFPKDNPIDNPRGNDQDHYYYPHETNILPKLGLQIGFAF